MSAFGRSGPAIVTSLGLVTAHSTGGETEAGRASKLAPNQSRVNEQRGFEGGGPAPSLPLRCCVTSPANAAGKATVQPRELPMPCCETPVSVGTQRASHAVLCETPVSCGKVLEAKESRSHLSMGHMKGSWGGGPLGKGASGYHGCGLISGGSSPTRPQRNDRGKCFPCFLLLHPGRASVSCPPARRSTVC